MDIVSKAVELWSKWAFGQFTCPQCKRFAGTTMDFSCCGNHVCVPCFENLKAAWRGEPAARCPFCQSVCGVVCYQCAEHVTSGQGNTTWCCNRSMCGPCVDRYCQLAADEAEVAGIPVCPICRAKIPDRA